MINNETSKILIEVQEDKRLEVAIELAKTVNNLSEMLKSMDVSIQNISLNGLNVQTAQGETAIKIGNNVKNTLVANSIFRTDMPTNSEIYNTYDEDDEDFGDEVYEEGIRTFNQDEEAEDCIEEEEAATENKKSLYELVLKRDQLKSKIDILSDKTNSNFGRHSEIWDVLSREQKELDEVEEQLKNL